MGILKWLRGSRAERQAAKTEIKERAEQQAKSPQLIAFFKNKKRKAVTLGLELYYIGRDSSFKVSDEEFAHKGTEIIRIEGDKIKIAHNLLATKYISRIKGEKAHAILKRHQGKFWIRDMSSLKGTFVNGKLIRKQQELQNENEIQLGINPDLKFIIFYKE